MKQDKRSKRTRAWLLETLLQLIEEKDYATISITELTDKADIARQTFYRNYTSKDDILLSEMAEVLDEYLANVLNNLETKQAPDWEFEVTQLISIWQEHKALFKALQKAGLAFQVLDKFSDFFSQFHMKVQKLTELDARHQYLIYYLSGGVYMVLNKWVENELDTPKDVLVDLFEKAASQVNEAAKGYINS